jgi:hypothetical protein
MSQSEGSMSQTSYPMSRTASQPPHHPATQKRTDSKALTLLGQPFKSLIYFLDTSTIRPSICGLTVFNSAT